MTKPQRTNGRPAVYGDPTSPVHREHTDDTQRVIVLDENAER